MPKNILSTSFTSRVYNFAIEHFGANHRRISIKEHENYDFVISAYAQTAAHGVVTDAKLTLPERLPTHQKTQLAQMAIGTKGLTVSDDANGTVVHLLKNPIAAQMQCTFIHELMHALSDHNFSINYGKDLDEGTTELFAREIMAIEDRNLLALRGKVYTHECDLAKSLVETFDRDAVKAAYFKGGKRIFELVYAGVQAKGLVKDWNRFKAAQGRTEDPPLFSLLPKLSAGPAILRQ